MTNHLFPVLKTLAISLLWAAPFALADPPTPTRFESVRDQITEHIEAGDAPSVSVAVIENDQVIWAEAFGWADIESQKPATPDTIYRLASISKSFTATGLMVLVDRGSVDLDAPANQYLPGEPLRAYLGSADEITVRRLANHTGGMPLHWNFFYPGHDPPDFDVTLRRYGFAYRKPGTHWEYSNLAYGVLDQVIANGADKTWSQFMEEEIYEPLGMSRTSDQIVESFQSDAATQYKRDAAGHFAPVLHYDFDHPGASAVVSSARDMVAYARLHLNNGEVDDVRILSDDAARQMRKPTAFSPGRNLGYGVAFNAGTYLGQPSNSSSGGMPGVSTNMRLFPNDRNAIIVLTNTSNHQVTNGVTRSIAKVLYPEADQESSESSPLPDAKLNHIEPFVGRWTGNVVRDGKPIPVVLEIRSNEDATVTLAGEPEKPLTDISINNQQFAGSTRGVFVTTHAYQGSSDIQLRLHRDGDRLVGRLTAMAPAYFALSHWIELDPSTD